MKRVLLLFVLAVCSPLAVAFSQENAPGLYEVTKEMKVVKPITLTISNASIESMSNDNKRYQVNFTSPAAFPLPEGSIGLVTGDKVSRMNSSGGGPQGKGKVAYSIGFELDVENDDVLQQLVNRYGAQVHKRHHPGAMLVSFEPTKKEFAPGERVTADLWIKNIGDKEFTFMRGGRQRGARDNQFAFSAEYQSKMLPDVGDPVNFGGIGTYVTLKPGQSTSIPVDISNWFQFDKPGYYSLRGSYSMEFIDPESMDHGFHIMWEDFACAEFTVVVKKPEEAKK